jgi:hypothetical protein
MSPQEKRQTLNSAYDPFPVNYFSTIFPTVSILTAE